MMSATMFAEKIANIAREIKESGADPLEYQLWDSYIELRDLAADLDIKVEIDSLLNDILEAKINRVQELARILSAPDIYVSRVQELTPMNLAKFISYRHPVQFGSMNYVTLNRALERILSLIQSISEEPSEDEAPKMSGIPDDFTFQTEDAIFIDAMNGFLSDIPFNKRFQIRDLISAAEFDVFLKRFLYVVILVSRGELSYDHSTGEVWKE
ncbi:hypothetical protein EU537_12800 [Candidatus Thorarchaeota archaeon]|nr:MAG: hypothetical protein EU537_12800 [Candidatus Thorarchaeota archaeon]